MENETPSYYAVIPADVRYDKRLKANEKLMYGEITCLSQKEGFCYASNSYFAELYDVTPQAISRWVKALESFGYIKCEYIHNGTEIKERRIYMTISQKSEKVEDSNSQNDCLGINKKLKGYQSKVKENTTRENITRTNTTSIKTKHKNGSFQNVLLTEEELNKLCQKLGPERAKAVIDNYSELKEMKGYKYNSDYLAILRWGIEAYEKKNASPNKNSYVNSRRPASDSEGCDVDF